MEHRRLSHLPTNAANAVPERRRILLVEGSPTVAMHVRLLLERQGYSVRLAADPCQADLANDHDDLLIIDARTPGGSALAEHFAAALLPVLALSPSGERLAMATATLDLPVTSAALQAALKRCLPAPPPPIDTGMIAELWDGMNNPMFPKVARIFINELQDRAERIAQAVPRGDCAAVELQAHSIKGAAAHVGVPAIAQAAARLEIRAARGEQAALAHRFACLQAAIAPGIEALHALIGASA
jgi:HPt (histidine-containing phosphotransfer) domain-containing protein/CheY-like chemotaxis protein